MGMLTAVLYNNNSDNRKVNKTLGEIKTVDCELKRPANNIELSIRILDSEWVDSANYVYLPLFNSYYFIKNYSYQAGGIVELYLGIDVLQTYSSYILGLYTFVERQEYKNNAYIIDNELPVRNNRKIDCIQCGNIGDPSGSNIILTVVGVD